MLSSEKIHSPGLCSTCNNADTCVYRAKRGYDAVYCENYDGFFVPSTGAKGDKGAVPEGLTKSPAESKPLKGLCVNCANRDNCTLPKPEGGVWHCEEYC